MALQTSGAISLNNVNVELGNSGTAQISMGSSAVRNLFGIPSGAISMSDGYGKANAFSFTISSSVKEGNLATLATSAGWDGSTALEATLASGVFLWSDNTSNAGLTISGTFSGGVTLHNYGRIIGRGGNGSSGAGGAGGPAIRITSTSSIKINNNTGAYIAGGGGGGGGAKDWVDNDTVHGGGGAGGGSGSGFRAGGGGSIGNLGSNGNFAGQGGSNATGGGGGGGGGGIASQDGGGAYGAAAGGGRQPWNNTAGSAATGGGISIRGGNGGNWGQAGNSGSGRSAQAGGAAGAAIIGSYTLGTNSGTIYGSS